MPIPTHANIVEHLNDAVAAMVAVRQAAKAAGAEVKADRARAASQTGAVS